MIGGIHDLPVRSTAVVAAGEVKLGTTGYVSVGFKGLPRLLYSQLVLKATVPATSLPPLSQIAGLLFFFRLFLSSVVEEHRPLATGL